MATHKAAFLMGPQTEALYQQCLSMLYHTLTSMLIMQQLIPQMQPLQRELRLNLFHRRMNLEWKVSDSNGKVIRIMNTYLVPFGRTCYMVALVKTFCMDLRAMT